MCFNPRTRAGCDKRSPELIKFLRRVSIHAPVQGATSRGDQHLAAIPVSIHAPVQGATNFRTKKITSKIGFNPRTRAGCDSLNLSLMYFLMCFNPRTRAGCDVIGQLVGKMVDEFQSTHPCRVRHLKHLTIIILLKFQSTHPCRVRREAWIDWFSQHMFQSTHPCRVRQTSIARTIGIKLVSIHAPVQGAT